MAGGKRKRGRPRNPKGPGKLIGLRWSREEIAALEAWAKRAIGRPGASIAIRLLVRGSLGLNDGEQLLDTHKDQLKSSR